MFVNTLSDGKTVVNNPKFYNADGFLTQYGLHCGYVQTEKRGKWEKELYHEHSTYHVRLIDTEKMGTQRWESYEKLTDAKKFYKSLKIDILRKTLA
jgi:hypothetical protein